MKRVIVSSLFIYSWVTLVGAFSPSADSGRNFPVVHSFDGGRHFVRSIPDEGYGSTGKTEMYRVTNDGDDLVEDYAVYMYGDLFFSWCRDQLGWGIVQLEPVRVSDPNDANKLGDISRLAFYLGGKKTREYSQDDLAEMGLRKRTGTLSTRGDFIVLGITEDYESGRAFFSLKTRNEDLTSEVALDFDACTGELIAPEPGAAGQPAKRPELK
jgi:hypothetical protein